MQKPVGTRRKADEPADYGHTREATQSVFQVVNGRFAKPHKSRGMSCELRYGETNRPKS